MKLPVRRPAALLALALAVCLLAGCLPAVPSAAPPPVGAPTATPGELVLLTVPPTADPSATEVPAESTPSPTPDITPDPDRTPTPEPTLAPDTPTPAPTQAPTATPLPEDGIYDSRDEVAFYLHTYGHLPSNYITKKDAQAMGWPGGKLDPYAYGKCIGGSRFMNLEGLLPNAPGRVWYECDIGTLHAKSRGVKRLVWSNDGLIFYTGDHYESFTQLF